MIPKREGTTCLRASERALFSGVVESAMIEMKAGSLKPPKRKPSAKAT